jgi:hypothetical protein
MKINLKRIKARWKDPKFRSHVSISIREIQIKVIEAKLFELQKELVQLQSKDIVEYDFEDGNTCAKLRTLYDWDEDSVNKILHTFKPDQSKSRRRAIFKFFETLLQS